MAGAGRLRGVADRVARSGADGVFLGGTPFTGGDKVTKALRARLGKSFPIIVTDCVPAFASESLKSQKDRPALVHLCELPRNGASAHPAR